METDFNNLLEQWQEESCKLKASAYNIPGVTVDPGAVVQKMQDLEKEMLALRGKGRNQSPEVASQ